MIINYSSVTGGLVLIKYHVLQAEGLSTPDILLRAEKEANSEEKTGGMFYMVKVHPTGSRYTCNPPVLNTDEDWIVWAEEHNDLEDKLMDEGYAVSADQEQYPDCMSYRKGNINIIVVYEQGMYDNWVKATEICKMLNVQSKEHRKFVHRILCDEELEL